MSDGTSSGYVVDRGIGEEGGCGMDGAGGSHTREVGSLHSSFRSIGRAVIGVIVGMNHMG